MNKFIKTLTCSNYLKYILSQFSCVFGHNSPRYITFSNYEIKHIDIILILTNIYTNYLLVKLSILINRVYHINLLEKHWSSLL